MWKAIGSIGLFLCAASGQQGPLARRVGAADVIAVGTSVGGSKTSGDGTLYSLQVARTIKGQAAATVLAVQVDVRKDPRLPPPPISIECGLWFLRQNATGWTALPVRVGGGSLDVWAFYYPLGSCESSPKPAIEEDVAERVLGELAAAAELFKGKKNYTVSLFYDVAPRDWPVLVRSLCDRFVRSPHTDLRLLGRAWQIVQGDAAALAEVEKEMPLLLQSPVSAILNTSLAEFANPDPLGVNALGRIALDRTKRHETIRMAALRALRSIHTKETLPYLFELLAEELPIREQAIAGFSYFRMNAPVLTDHKRDEAIDRAFREFLASRPNQAEQNAIRLGHIADPVEAATVAEYWRNWFQVNRLRLGV